MTNWPQESAPGGSQTVSRPAGGSCRPPAVDRWARVLGGTISLTTAVAAVAAAASSASIVDGVSRDFPVVRSTATGSKTLLLGPLATGGSLHLDLEPPHELHMSVENVDILEVLGRASIASTCGTED